MSTDHLYFQLPLSWTDLKLTSVDFGEWLQRILGNTGERVFVFLHIVDNVEKHRVLIKWEYASPFEGISISSILGGGGISSFLFSFRSRFLKGHSAQIPIRI